MFGFQPIEEEDLFDDDFGRPTREEVEVLMTELERQRRPDPHDPRSDVDPDMASPMEVLGTAEGPDPLRMRRNSERVTVADPFNDYGMGFK